MIWHLELAAVVLVQQTKIMKYGGGSKISLLLFLYTVQNDWRGDNGKANNCNINAKK